MKFRIKGTCVFYYIIQRNIVKDIFKKNIALLLINSIDY